MDGVMLWPRVWVGKTLVPSYPGSQGKLLQAISTISISAPADGDGVQPGGEASPSVVIAVNVDQGVCKGVLSYLFCVVRVAQQAIGQSESRIPEMVIQNLGGPFIAFPPALYQRLNVRHK